MLIFSFLILFWVTSRLGLHAVMLKKLNQICHTVKCCSTQAPLIGQLRHA